MARPGGGPTRPLWPDAAIRRAVQVAIRQVPPRGRGLRAARLVDRVVPPDPSHLFRARVPGGARISLDLADPIQACIFYTGAYEPEVTELLRAEIRPGDVFVDVGANAGYFSLVASGLCGRDGLVHAFELDPALAGRLRADAARLDGSFAPVVVHNVAVLSRRQVVSVVEPAEARSGPGERYVERCPTGAAEAITATSIDELLPDLRFDVAKIDVEGAEVEVIRGAADAISRSSPRLLVVEGIDTHLARFGASLDALREEMAGLGYASMPIRSRFFAPMLAFRPQAHRGR